MTAGRLRALELFADLLTYPTGSLAAAAAECRGLIAGECSEAADLLGEFERFAASQPASLLEEFYTATFDFGDSCQPYLGGKLFGESYKRSVLLVGLAQQYREHGFSAGQELPDHMAVVLRFLSFAWGSADADEIADYALLPVLDKIVAGFDGAEERALELRARQVYGYVLRSLHAWLTLVRGTTGAVKVAVETAG